MEYYINPVRMGGLVKSVEGDSVKIHLHGRLGVLTVPRNLILSGEEIAPGLRLRFWFSYVQIVPEKLDYDTAEMRSGDGETPCLLGGTLTEVNDTAVKLQTVGGLGTVAVPRRWVFTDVALAVGQSAEFYLSRMAPDGKRDLPAEFI